MNIIELAKEAGFDLQPDSSFTTFYEYALKGFERFSALVRAEALEEAAKVCDEQFNKYGCVADKCAAAIRGLK